MINKKILSEIRVKWFKYRYYSLILLYICISVSFSIFLLSPIKLKVKNNTIKYEQKYNEQHDLKIDYLTFNAEINNNLYEVIVEEKDSSDTYTVTCKGMKDCCFNYYMTDYINIKKITTGNINVFYYNPTNRLVVLVLLILIFIILGLFLFIDGNIVCDFIYVNCYNEIYVIEDNMWTSLIPSERYVIIVLKFLGYDYDSEK